MIIDDGKKPVTCVKKLLYDVLMLLSHIITASHKNWSDAAENAKKIVTNLAKYLEIIISNFITTFGKNCKNVAKIPKLITMKNM